VIWRCAFWSMLGGVLGAGVGFALGSSGLGTFPGMSNSLPLQVASWAMFLHVGGALWGAYVGISNGRAWELTFQPVESGRVFVNVAASNEHDGHRAKRVLRSKAALSVSRAGPATPAAAAARYALVVIVVVLFFFLGHRPVRHQRRRPVVVLASAPRR
jgi:hypothetical protein